MPFCLKRCTFFFSFFFFFFFFFSSYNSAAKLQIQEVQAVLKAAGEFGLGAGRIYIENPLDLKIAWSGAHAVRLLGEGAE